MTFVPVEGAFKQAILEEARSNDTNGQLLNQDIELDNVDSLPTGPVFWGAGSIVAAILNCCPKVVTPIMCVGTHQGNRYGITIEAEPRAVIINHEDLNAGNVLFAKNTTATRTTSSPYSKLKSE
jgi:hypothetical protein